LCEQLIALIDLHGFVVVGLHLVLSMASILMLARTVSVCKAGERGCCALGSPSFEVDDAVLQITKILVARLQLWVSAENGLAMTAC